MSTGLLGRYLNKETTPSSSALPLNGLFKFGMSSKIIQQLEHRHKKHPEKKQIGPLQWDVNLALRDLFSGVENGSIYIYTLVHKLQRGSLISYGSVPSKSVCGEVQLSQIGRRKARKARKARGPVNLRIEMLQTATRLYGRNAPPPKRDCLAAVRVDTNILPICGVSKNMEHWKNSSCVFHDTQCFCQCNMFGSDAVTNCSLVTWRLGITRNTKVVQIAGPPNKGSNKIKEVFKC